MGTGRAVWAWMLVALSWVASPCLADTVPYTIAYDYSNNPNTAALVAGPGTFAAAVVSPRVGVAELEAAGLEVFFWVQPLKCKWNGSWVSGWAWEDSLNVFVERHGVLRDTTGAEVSIEGSDISGCYVLDITNQGAQSHLLDLLRNLGQRIVMDYGCRDLAWEPNLSGVDPPVWRTWGSQYHAIKAGLPGLICQCDRPTQGCAGLLWEKIGWSLNPVPKVWAGVRHAEAGTNILQATTRDPGLRSTIASIALLTDSYFSWGLDHPHENLRAPEYFRDNPGPFYGPYWTRRDGLVQRIGRYGMALYNPTEAPVKYSRWTLEAAEGLVLSTRDRQTGRFKRWERVE